MNIIGDPFNGGGYPYTGAPFDGNRRATNIMYENTNFEPFTGYQGSGNTGGWSDPVLDPTPPATIFQPIILPAPAQQQQPAPQQQQPAPVAPVTVLPAAQPDNTLIIVAGCVAVGILLLGGRR